MCKVISISNQKGGVAKTVTSVNIGIGLAREGRYCSSMRIRRAL